MAEFSCTTDISPGLALIRAAGEIDLATADRLWDEIATHLSPGVRVVLDCSAITFCDSIGLRTLIRAHQQAEDTDAYFALASTDGPIERLLALAGLTGHIATVDSRSGVLA
jgi:stage II sporulation protein AA (anti-sigma F factor antagonist)